MGAVWRYFGALLVVSGAALLLAPLAAAGIARSRRRAGASTEWAWRSALTEVGMVVGTLPPVWIILTPFYGPSRIVTPLQGLHEDLAGGPLRATIQVGGNLLVFAAFGLLGPLRWRIGARQVWVVASAASAVLEILQYVLHLGRVTDLVDVILNGGGAGLAALCVRPWWLRGRTVDDRDGIDVGTASVGPHRYGGRST